MLSKILLLTFTAPLVACNTVKNRDIPPVPTMFYKEAKANGRLFELAQNNELWAEYKLKKGEPLNAALFYDGACRYYNEGGYPSQSDEACKKRDRLDTEMNGAYTEYRKELDYKNNTTKETTKRETSSNTEKSNQRQSPPSANQTREINSNSARKNGNNPCNEDLTHLASRIPSFRDADIAKIRTMLLQTNLPNTIRDAKTQGFTSNSAIRAALEQAKENEKTARQGTECASDVDAWGTTDQAFYKAISTGMIDRNINCKAKSIRTSCLCVAIINKISAVGSRAIAAEMQCYAKNGIW